MVKTISFLRNTRKNIVIELHAILPYKIQLVKTVLSRANYTTLYANLTPKQAKKLKNLAKKQGKTESEVLRQILDAYLKDIEYKGLPYEPFKKLSVFLTLANTGMRLGELINLEWTDVDFERRTITIKVKDFWEPKNSKPRVIPMTNKLVEVLKDLKKDSRWVFTTRNGRQLNRNHLRERLVKVCMNIGIELANIHTFRHTFASHLIMKGVDLPTIQKLMGHSDIKTTMIYAHLAPEHLKSAIEKLEL